MKARGTTLLELIVTIAIAALSFMILGAVFLAQARYLAIVNAASDTQYDAFQVMDTFGLYADAAQAVVSSQTINGRAYASGTSTIVLKLPSIDSSGTIISGSYDYVAFGLFQSDPTKFMFDIQPAAGSSRLSGQFIKAQLVDKLIFRYNAVDPTAATAIELYVRTTEDARGQTITTPLGKIYYLGSS